MAMTLRFTETEDAELKARAAADGRSVTAVIHDAIAAYLADDRARALAIAERVIVEDADLLDRLRDR